MANELQRTTEWYLARKGKITASECYVLLNNSKGEVPLTQEEQDQFRAEHPRAKMPETKKVDVPFSAGTYTYLDDKVAELYMPGNSFIEYMEDKPTNKAMQWGTFWESAARNRYAEIMGCEVLDAPFVALKGFEKFAGGSPDGIVRDYSTVLPEADTSETAATDDGGFKGIVEIKCPFNPAVHLRHYLYETPEDLKEDNLQYYVQCQYNMLCVSKEFGTDIEYCDFISYDPRTSESKTMKVLRIPADKEMQALLLERTELAVGYLREQIERIENMDAVIYG